MHAHTHTPPVSDLPTRQHRVHNEMEAGRRWEENWGWLAAPPAGDPAAAAAAAAGPTSSKVATKDSMDRFLASHGGSCTSTIKLSLRSQKHQQSQPQGHYKVTASSGCGGGDDAVDEFVRQYMIKCGGSSMRSVGSGPHSHMQGPAIRHTGTRFACACCLRAAVMCVVSLSPLAWDGAGCSYV